MVVRYDGTDFAGSQIQPGKRTVAGTLTAGLESLLQQQVKLVFASRTDSGVHANGNLCAFDGSLPFPAVKLPGMLEKALPNDLVVRAASVSAPDFHPRFDALARSYVYRCYLDKDVPVDRMRYVATFANDWDISRLRGVLELLQGRHCFAGYSASELSAVDSMCELTQARVTVRGPEVAFRLTANRFLRHMVVRIVGALVQVADGRLDPEQVRTSLNGARDFQLRPAPAKGLILDYVQYKC